MGIFWIRRRLSELVLVLQYECCHIMTKPKTQYTDYAVWDMIDLLDFTSASMKENIIF